MVFYGDPREVRMLTKGENLYKLVTFAMPISRYWGKFKTEEKVNYSILQLITWTKEELTLEGKRISGEMKPVI